MILHFHIIILWKVLCFNYVRIIQNIPQLVIQIVYILFGTTGNPHDIVYFSMAFSVLSIAISTMSMISQRNISKSRDYISVELDVKGNVIITNMKKCRNEKCELELQISSLLGINKNLVEVTRPQQIQKGLRIKINLKINYVKSIDMNIERDLNDAKQTGELAEILKASWRLNQVPMISTIKCNKYDSK